MQLGVDKIVTGHNADDIAETVVIEHFRGDIAPVTALYCDTTGSDTEGISRCKPFKYTYEKDRDVRLLQEARLLQHCALQPQTCLQGIRQVIKEVEKIPAFAIVISFIPANSSMSRRRLSLGCLAPGDLPECGYISARKCARPA